MKTNLLAVYCMIKASLLPLVLLFISSLTFAQISKTYAIQQINQISGICLGCSVQNPQNAVGNNENDFSNLQIGVGVLGKVEQTLVFPQPTNKNLIIGIGTDNIPLSVSLLNGVTVETMNGNTPNNDTHIIDNSILKLGAQTNKATIELSPLQSYDRVKISLNGGLLNLSGGLQLYYAYNYNILPSVCNSVNLIPAPLHYYPFNGDSKDLASTSIMGFELKPSPAPYDFNSNMICGKGLAPTTSTVLQSPPLTVPLKEPKTVSFWASVDKSYNNTRPNITLKMYGKEIILNADSIAIQNIDNTPSGYMGNLLKIEPGKYSELNHYTIVFKEEPFPVYNPVTYEPYKDLYPATVSHEVCLYINGYPGAIPFNNPNYPGDLTFMGFPKYINCVHWRPNYSSNNGALNISIKAGAKIDELLIYNHAFSSTDVKNLYLAYKESSPATTVMKTMVTEEIFTVSPNPTAGQITLNGNILLLDSDISIRNTSGTEVYRSTFRSKTFDLPANLPEGVYILTVQTKDRKNYTRKIILKK